MKLVFVHGRSQQGRSAAEIESEWMDALTRGCSEAGTQLPDATVSVPFYGDLLDDMTKRIRDRVDAVVARGEADPQGIDPFQFEILMAIKEEAGITDQQIFEEMQTDVIERGPTNWEFVHAAARLLSRRVPWLSESVIATFLADVDAYMNYDNVTEAINNEVSSAVEGSGDCIVVGHSLGSVVSYWVLTKLGGSERVRLFLTLGSPLGIHAIKNKLPRPLAVPEGTNRWLNAADEGDVVALYSRLDKTTFVTGIENVEVENPDGREHWIGGYLSQRVIARNIVSALS